MQGQNPVRRVVEQRTGQIPDGFHEDDPRKCTHAGYNEVQMEIAQVVAARMSQSSDQPLTTTGILLFGPVGTGKTDYAEEIALKLNLKVVRITPANVLKSYVGESPKAVAEVFNYVCAPGNAERLLLLIDEIDAIAKANRGLGDTNPVTPQIVSQFNQSLDMAAKAGIIWVATTNHPAAVNEAVRRRINKTIYVPLPSFNDRKEIIRQYVGSRITEEDVEDLAQVSEGETCSEIVNILRATCDPHNARLHVHKWYAYGEDGKLHPASEGEAGAISVREVVATGRCIFSEDAIDTVPVEELKDALIGQQRHRAVTQRDLDEYESFMRGCQDV